MYGPHGRHDVIAYSTLFTISTQLNSTQFIDVWQLWSWIEQTQRTHNKTQSIETPEHKNTKNVKTKNTQKMQTRLFIKGIDNETVLEAYG